MYAQLSSLPAFTFLKKCRAVNTCTSCVPIFTLFSIRSQVLLSDSLKMMERELFHVFLHGSFPSKGSYN